MRRQIKFNIMMAIVCMATACGTSKYEVSDPKPVLEVTAMQSTYAVGEAAYIQIKVSQRGYSGSFQLSTVVSEGSCSIALNGSEIAADGSWKTLSNSTEILTLTPLQSGTLRLSFEVKAKESEQSGRSYLNLSIGGSTALDLTAKYLTTASIKEPVEITLRVVKPRYEGQLPVKFIQQSGSGSVQFGAVVVADGNSFSCPPNIDQVLYYTAAERGVHKLQFSVSDGYVTKFKDLEIIITN